MDPELPELVTIEKDKVLSVLKSRERLRKDKETAGKIRTMIELREQLMGNEPGRLVHGRALLQPVVPHHKKNSKTNGMQSIRGGTHVGMTSIDEFPQNKTSGKIGLYNLAPVSVSMQNLD